MKFAAVSKSFPGTGPLAQLFTDLDNLMLDCFRPGWDGHNARAMSPAAYGIAQRFVRALPAGIECPTLSADPDGCAVFEWYASPRRLVYVSVHPDFRVDYAALFGSSRIHGSSPFFDQLPPELLDLVRRVFGA